MSERKKKKLFKTISLLCLIFCFLLWMPNILFQIPSGFWILTFIVAPIGAIFAWLARYYALLVANIIMTFSFMIFMATGHVINFFAS